MIRALAILGGLCLAAAPASAQSKDFKMPRESPAALVRQEIGVASMQIAYARPAAKGRDLAAELAADRAKTGKPWRFGADAATELTLDAPAKIAGKDVAAGAYALFAEPGAASWTLILNAVSKQWGAYFHDAAKDVLRFEVRPETAEHVERLTFALDLKGDDVIVATFRWGAVRLAFDVAFDLPALEERMLATALRDLDPKDWRTRLGAAQLRLKRGRAADALRLLEEAEAAAAHFWIDEWKARALHALGRDPEALPLLDRALEGAAGKAPEGYLEGLRKLAREWRAAPPR
ncbi:MAG TPA: DUF2911 domain-containing protein [Planctomycetota bacterium]|nr:DUF2911 domain-containing protein [Planctomycetota bacterium]